MARPRRKRNSGLPENLYRHHDPRTGRDYYRYRDPRNGKFHGLGTDYSQAVADAKSLNAAILSGLESMRRAAILEKKMSGIMFGQAILRHMEHAETLHSRGRLAVNTMKTKRSTCAAWQKRLGDRPIDAVSVRDIAQVLAEYIDAGKERMAQSLRSEAIEVFKTAITEGWVNDNPAAKTRNPSPEVRRARLTLDVYKAVYDTASHTWLKNSMALALLTGQRREDVVLAKYADIRDGAWWCVQTKTKNRVAIPLDLRLDAIGMSLADVVRQCRATGIVSRHLVHQTRPRGNSPVGSPIWKDTLSKAFHEAILTLGMDWGDKHPPTFHEIRSLSERLYTAQGNINTQSLLGHKDPRSTAIYKDTRGADWVFVKVG